MDIYPLIGKRIREERKKRKLTIEQLAEASSISPSFLTYIELGQKKASVETFRKVSSGLGVSLKSLFSSTGSSEISPQAFNKLDLILKGRNPKDRELIMKVVNLLSRELKAR